MLRRLQRLRLRTFLLLFVAVIAITALLFIYVTHLDNYNTVFYGVKGKSPSFSDDTSGSMIRHGSMAQDKHLRPDDIDADTEGAILYIINNTKLVDREIVPNILTELSEKAFSDQVMTFLIELSSDDYTQNNTEDILLEINEFLLDHVMKNKTYITCKEIDAIQIKGYANFAATFSIAQHGTMGHEDVLVKTAAIDRLVQPKCTKKDNSDGCETVLNYKLAREILLHTFLKHSYIANMKGFCIRGLSDDLSVNRRGMVLILQMGEVAVDKILRTGSMLDRLQLGLDVADILQYLDQSPAGSLGLEGITSDNFLHIDDRTKLADLSHVKLNELSCSNAKMCFINGRNANISCENHHCIGHNVMSNIVQVCQSVLRLLLAGLPPFLSQRVTSLLSDCNDFKLSVKPLKDRLDDLQIEIAKAGALYDNGLKKNKLSPSAMERSAETKYQPTGAYKRLESYNFPGMFDYVCPQSRVTWGCVLDVSGLADAMRKCDNDPICKAFVAFTLTPEVQAVFTIIMKNSFIDNPVRQKGSTVFIKLTAAVRQNVKKIADQSSTSLKGCVKNVTSEYKRVFRNREKKLMSHLGMKGIEEEQWLEEVRTSTFTNFAPVCLLSMKHPQVCDVQVELQDTEVAEVNNSVMILDIRDGHSFIAAAIVHHIDRMLGLYHVPPVLLRSVSLSRLDSIKNEAWFSAILDKAKKGKITGALTVPKPAMVTVAHLQGIMGREDLTVAQVDFGKAQKMQLELLLLNYIIGVREFNNGYVGFKGHLLQFEGYAAFHVYKSNYLKQFLNNCHFPEQTYHILNCFRCETGVCQFGEYVISTLHKSSLKSQDIMVGFKDKAQLELWLTSSASSVVQIMDACINAHGEVNVLY